MIIYALPITTVIALMPCICTSVAEVFCENKVFFCIPGPSSIIIVFLLFSQKLISVVVSFDPTSYTVTEGDDGFAVLTLVRSGDLSRATVVTVTTADDSAIGM